MENAATTADRNIDTTCSESDYTLEVIDDTTLPSACDVTVAPSTGDIVRPDGSAFSFTIQTRSADGRNQMVIDDDYTVTLTSISTEEQAKKDSGESYNEVILTDTAAPVGGSDGLYTADIQVTQEGSYKVYITMENAYTRDNPDISTVGSVDALTLDVTDITTVPSQSTLVTSPAGNTVDSGMTASYTLQSNDASGTTQAVTTDSYTVTLTCQSGALCGNEVYSYTSTASSTTNGQYDVVVSPTLGGVYDVSITMENTATAADQNIDTAVSGIFLTLEVIDDTTVPSAC